MTEPRKMPDPDDVSVEYLYQPRPPSHEFRFRMKTMMVVMTVVALVCGLIGFVVSLFN